MRWRRSLPRGLRATTRCWRRVTGELCGADAEVVTIALAAFMDPPSEGEDRTPAQRRADALVRICEVALARGVAASRAKADVTIVVDWETLMDDVFGRADGMFTGPIHRREIERLLCDCQVSRVVMGPGSKPLDVGRQGQSWPRWIRRGIIARDCGCRWPGCEIPPGWCEAHHVNYWQHGGETSIANGVLLCSRHHQDRKSVV